MSSHRRILFIVVVLLVAGVLACNGGPAKPTVEILSPPSGAQVAVGEQVEVEYRASDATAVIRVDLEVDGQAVDSQSAPVAEGQPSLSGMLRWTPTEEGTYALLVYAYNRDRTPSDPVGVNIVVGEGAAPESTATISLILPGATGTPGGISTQPPETPAATRQPGAPTATPTTRPPAATPTTRPPAATPTTRPPAATATTRPPTATATTDLASLWVVNESGVEVCEIYISAAGAPWGENQLIGGTRIQNGQSALWEVTPGNKDFQAWDCSGTLLDDRRNVAVSGSYDWVIPAVAPPMATVNVINQSGVDICEIYISDAGAPWGNNWLWGGGFIASGGSTSYEVTAGNKDFWAKDCGGIERDVKRNVAVSGSYDWVIPPAAPPTASLWVTNNSGVDVCEVYISAAGAPWGDNQLTGGDRIQTGQSALWEVTPGNKDFLALDCSGTVLDDQRNVAVHGSYDWVIWAAGPPPPPPPEPASVTVYNNCGEPMCCLFLFRQGEDRGWNELAGGSIPAGGSQTYGIESGDWIFEAYDCSDPVDCGHYYLDSFVGYVNPGAQAWYACGQ